jgi:hypothetical protein
MWCNLQSCIQALFPIKTDDKLHLKATKESCIPQPHISLLCSLVFFYGAAVAYIISAVCIPTPSSNINRTPVIDERISFNKIMVNNIKAQMQQQGKPNPSLGTMRHIFWCPCHFCSPRGFRDIASQNHVRTFGTPCSE